MAVRKKTNNRFTLIRTCQTCGRVFTTTAASPWMRQMAVDGKKQKTCYFCSESCKNDSYKHHFDGKADERRKARESARDNTERNRLYYTAHAGEIKQVKREAYWNDPEEYRERNRYNRWKRRIMDEP